MKRDMALGIVFLAVFFSISVVVMSYINIFHEPSDSIAEEPEITGSFLGLPTIYRDIIGVQIMTLATGILFILNSHQD